MGKERRKLFEIFLIVLIINVGLVGVPSAYAGVGSVCGNGICEGSENAKSCPADCSSSGPAICDGTNEGATCTDGNSCTQDTCQGGVCVGKALEDGLACSDGNSCTLGDVCTAGVCTPTKTAPDGAECNDGNLCTSGEVCSAGVCQGGSPISCDDADVCTADTCDPAKGCLNSPVADGTTCDDGLFCTSGDVCTGGVCESTSTPCTSSETCDESSEQCVPGPVCGDGVVDQGEICDDGENNGTPGFCNATCTGFEPVCGNGITEDPEICDDGENKGTPGFCNATCTGESVGCTVDTDCAEGEVCDTNTSTCIQEETQQTSGEVNILETCGLAFVKGNPILYPAVLPGGISDPEQLLVLDNTGNVVAALLVKGGDWVDGGNNVIMNVGDTKYAITTPQDYVTQKIALTAADKIVTAAFDPVVDQNTYWQLQANLLNNNFAGDLTQTMDFTVTC